MSCLSAKDIVHISKLVQGLGFVIAYALDLSFVFELSDSTPVQNTQPNSYLKAIIMIQFGAISKTYNEDCHKLLRF